MSHRPPEEAPAVRIEADNEWAWCGERRLELTPRAFAVASMLFPSGTACFAQSWRRASSSTTDVADRAPPAHSARAAAEGVPGVPA